MAEVVVYVEEVSDEGGMLKNDRVHRNGLKWEASDSDRMVDDEDEKEMAD